MWSIFLDEWMSEQVDEKRLSSLCNNKKKALENN